MLYLVATPIGNLGDLSARAIEVLSAVETIYCEDTRHTGLLLNHFNVRKPTRSLHTHNERERTDEVAAVLKDGRDVAFVSDAGMPGVSDPGAMLVAACQKEGLPHTVIPVRAPRSSPPCSPVFPRSRSAFSAFSRANRSRAAKRSTRSRPCITRSSCMKVRTAYRRLYRTFSTASATDLRRCCANLPRNSIPL